MWYEQHLREATSNRLTSTKGAHSKDLKHLIEYFRSIVGPGMISISTWSDSQVSRFMALSESAYNCATTDGYHRSYQSFIQDILSAHIPIVKGVWAPPDRKESFDNVMADMAVRAGDEFWITRTSEAGERRMRWQINRFLGDLDFLDKRFTHGWEYIRSIYKQSDLLPADIDECPANILWKVLQMLDTHIRRLCKDFDIRPMDLPSRSRYTAVHLAVNSQAKHLHVGNALEHISEPVKVYSDDVPF
jgi:hypothetical protein